MSIGSRDVLALVMYGLRRSGVYDDDRDRATMKVPERDSVRLGSVNHSRIAFLLETYAVREYHSSQMERFARFRNYPRRGAAEKLNFHEFLWKEVPDTLLTTRERASEQEREKEKESAIRRSIQITAVAAMLFSHRDHFHGAMPRGT